MRPHTVEAVALESSGFGLHQHVMEEWADYPTPAGQHPQLPDGNIFHRLFQFQEFVQTRLLVVAV